MDDLIYVKQFVDACAGYDPAAFERAVGRAVLIGISVVGDLKDAAEAQGKTMAVRAVADLDPALALRDRVWPLRRTGGTGVGVTVGRDVNNDVVIPETSVSQHHCEFVIGPDKAEVRDLGSSNGTQYGGKRLLKNRMYPVQDGQEITLGRYRVRFVRANSFLKDLKRRAEPV